jgi:hypothetical protein
VVVGPISFASPEGKWFTLLGIYEQFPVRVSESAQRARDDERCRRSLGSHAVDLATDFDQIIDSQFYRVN